MRMDHDDHAGFGIRVSGFGLRGSRWHTAPHALRTLAAVTLWVCMATPLAFGQTATVSGKPGPLAHTFSIRRARPATGELGSRSSRTGSRSARSSPGRKPGVGAVATQSFVDPAYGHRAWS